MRTKTSTRKAGLVLAVLTVAVSLPELARAQQSGLFPLAPIRRKRVPCDQEDPVYKAYKEKYYGYHPTCWRPFPGGWGCPSPEAPDRAKSFREVELGSTGEAEAEAPGEERMRQPETTKPGLPAIPGRERSPFILDKPESAPPQGGQPPRSAPPGVDPFELPDQGAGAPLPRGNAPARPSTNPRDNSGPNAGQPAAEPGQGGGPRAARDDLDDTSAPDAGDAPLLALPRIDLPPPDDLTSGSEPKSVVPVPSSDRVAANLASAPAPAPSSTRRGLLSGLFSSLGWNWLRR